MSHTTFEIVLSFFMVLIVSGATAYYASRKGKNPVLWFLLGFLFGIFPMIILYFLTFRNKSEEKKEQEKNEQGKKPIMPDSSVSGTSDISSTSSQYASPNPLSEADVAKQKEENIFWFYLDKDHKQMGPVNGVFLQKLWDQKELVLSDYVWSKGMENWEKIENLPELKGKLIGLK